MAELLAITLIVGTIAITALVIWLFVRLFE